jgi:hypothetical protein
MSVLDESLTGSHEIVEFCIHPETHRKESDNISDTLETQNQQFSLNVPLLQKCYTCCCDGEHDTDQIKSQANPPVCQVETVGSIRALLKRVVEILFEVAQLVESSQSYEALNHHGERGMDGTSEDTVKSLTVLHRSRSLVQYVKHKRKCHKQGNEEPRVDYAKCYGHCDCPENTLSDKNDVDWDDKV